MSELCRKCFIETWFPNTYDIEHIVMSEDNEFCEGCMDCVPYVDHIDTSELRHVESADDFFKVIKTEKDHDIACPECGAVFDSDDKAYTYETGLCQYCHRFVRDIWVKNTKKVIRKGD